MLWISIMPVVIILSVGTKLSGHHLPHPARASQRLLLLVLETNLRALPHPLHTLPGPSVFHCSAFFAFICNVLSLSVSQSQVSTELDCLSVLALHSCSVSAEWLPDHLLPLDSGTYRAISVYQHACKYCTHLLQL